jgi:hypothetical protein
MILNDFLFLLNATAMYLLVERSRSLDLLLDGLVKELEHFAL